MEAKNDKNDDPDKPGEPEGLIGTQMVYQPPIVDFKYMRGGVMYTTTIDLSRVEAVEFCTSWDKGLVIMSHGTTLNLGPRGAKKVAKAWKKYRGC